ncbi:MAG: O-antigen ligase family protein [Candidatus Omnitrophica bacterium]|nr:O-antigen ligase family protein [Candidatus Omnitrophota bacterium]
MRNVKKISYLEILLAVYIISVVAISFIPGGNVISKLIGYVLAVSWLFEILIFKRKVNITPEVIFFCCWLIFGILTMARSSDPSLSFARLLTIVQLVILLLVSVDILVAKKLDFIIFSYIVSVFYAAGIGFLQISNSNDLIRITGTLENANAFGVAVLFAMVFLFYMALVTPKWFVKLVCYGAVGFLFVLLLRSGSRKAMIGVLAFPIIYLFVSGIAGIKKFSWKRTFFTILTLFLCGYLVYHSPFWSRLHDALSVVRYRDTSLADASLSERIQMFTLGFQLFLQHPFLGIGIDNFGNYLSLSPETYSRFAYAHSNYIEVLATTGAIGFTLYYAIYYTIFRRFLVIMKLPLLGKKDHTLLCVLLALFILIIFLEFAMVSYAFKVVWLIFAIMIAFQRSVIRKMR